MKFLILYEQYQSKWTNQLFVRGIFVCPCLFSSIIIPTEWIKFDNKFHIIFIIPGKDLVVGITIL